MYDLQEITPDPSLAMTALWLTNTMALARMARMLVFDYQAYARHAAFSHPCDRGIQPSRMSGMLVFDYQAYARHRSFASMRPRYTTVTNVGNVGV